MLLILCTLAACGNRRSFDERYDETANEIAQRAEVLDTDLNKGASVNKSEAHNVPKPQ